MLRVRTILQLTWRSVTIEIRVALQVANLLTEICNISRAEIIILLAQNTNSCTKLVF